MIDITKQYATRDGRTVRLLCDDGPTPNFPIAGFMGTDLYTTNWTINGTWFIELIDGRNDSRDLVEIIPKIVTEST